MLECLLGRYPLLWIVAQEPVHQVDTQIRRVAKLGAEIRIADSRTARLQTVDSFMSL